MVRWVLNGAIAILVIGLGLALLIAFDWNVTAVTTWVWTSIIGAIQWVADWFLSAEWFQNLVAS